MEIQQGKGIEQEGILQGTALKELSLENSDNLNNIWICVLHMQISTQISTDTSVR